ncbi:phosphoribosyltransferase [Bordetella petrii]|uniref:phosphoribosyltransferase n=1 Tax=Bordetella petrii TaxID=94624 RepID=UPI001E284720|nr:phosphoribosyltransferase family protein [Bordetella petrii]MCD0505460.1 phosphoribosyltransferase domain-containing protein [Bordetella petrii]
MLTARTAFPYDYARVEQVVAEHVPRWRGMGFDAVVAIARGGLAPALIASAALDLPLYAVSYQRQARQVSWFTAQTPAAGARVLLVEDIAGRGTTLSDSIEFLAALGYRLSVFTLAYDAESRVRPDFGVEMPAGLRAWFPWERESITPAYDATDNAPALPSNAYASWAIDLDGILLPDLPTHLYESDLAAALAQRDLLVPSATLPGRDLRLLPIITGRPEQDRARTQAWLHRHGFQGPLVMRDAARHSAAQTAEHKAQAIVAGCHTHFIESDMAQALEIARLVKVARVYWWNGQTALAIYASHADELR